MKGGKLYIDSREVRGALKAQAGEHHIVVDFLKGRKDNPKVNALLMVKGPASKTHKESFSRYQRLLIKLQEEREKQKAQEESFFQENDFDYEETTDGLQTMNQLMGHQFYLFEGAALACLFAVISVLPK